ncbi:hypothetical protein [Butyricimonas synergistica]|uniref:hypothetical protein n=1 Tax=Butyricimonas synergistica TaxID=544644 RepID=UPI0003A1CEB5|nr:hypothetical protein [Butyricimonas synergistica]
MKEVFIMMGVMLLIVTGCQDITVGYLETRDAVYAPDSMIVKSVLDPVGDARQIEFEIPWQSTSIEGILGTAPIRYSIKNIASEHPDATSQFSMQGAGIIKLPWNHTVPPGRYVFDVEVSNEGYNVVLERIFTVIVE